RRGGDLIGRRDLAEAVDSWWQALQLGVDVELVGHRKEKRFAGVAAQALQVLFRTGPPPEAEDFQQDRFLALAVAQAEVGDPEALAQREDIRLLGDLPVGPALAE